MEVNNVNLNTPLYKGTNTFRARWAAIRLPRLVFAILPRKNKGRFDFGGLKEECEWECCVTETLQRSRSGNAFKKQRVKSSHKANSNKIQACVFHLF